MKLTSKYNLKNIDQNKKIIKKKKTDITKDFIQFSFSAKYSVNNDH